VTYSKAILKRFAKLKQKKYREAERLFLAEGRTFVEEALVPSKYLFTDLEAVKRLSTLATPTGPVAVFSFLDVPTVELLEKSERIVLLHGVQDPGNVGTVIRTAHAFGAGIALSPGTADLYNPKTVRATMGSIFHSVGAEGTGLPEEIISACQQRVKIPALAASLNAAVAASILLYEAYSRVLP
jgi:TrmH family RNA methyltransferase